MHAMSLEGDLNQQEANLNGDALMKIGSNGSSHGEKSDSEPSKFMLESGSIPNND